MSRQRRGKRTGIASMRHRVVLCSQQDRVEAAKLKLNRVGVGHRWAMIENKRRRSVSREGATVSVDATHVITVRYDPNLLITNLAWIYEDRGKSAPRWFRVQEVQETEDAGTAYISMSCLLTDQSDGAARPLAEEHSARSGPAAPLPPGVSL